MNPQSPSQEINKPNQLENLLQTIKQKVEKSWITQKIQEKIKISLNLIVIVYIIILFWMTSFIASWELTFFLIAVPGAAIKSLKSIESKDKDDTFVRSWLVYWLLIALIHLSGPILNILLEYIIPFYYFFKLGFIYWLQRDNAKGVLYQNVYLIGARTIFEEFIKDAQFNIDKLKAKLEDIMDKLSNRNF